MIGIHTANEKRRNQVRNTYFTESAGAFAFIGNCCSLEPFSKNIAKHQDSEYGKVLHIGSVVEVTLDCDHHTLRYQIDDEDQGIAFDRLPAVEYCLAVTMTQKQDCLRIISYCGQQFH